MKNIYLFFAIVCISHLINAQTVPNFLLKDIESQTQSFENLKGEKLTLIDFWATWCKPCVKAIPKLNEIYKDYKEKGVNIIGVNCDGPRSISKVEPMSKALAIEYPVLLDIDNELRIDLDVNYYPTLIMVNQKNEIVWLHEGYGYDDDKLIVQQIEKQLMND
jgi:thiol-disulfide isomerase/thioredoxin